MPLIAITTVQITFMANDHSVSGHFLHVAASHGVVPAFHYYASPSLVKLTARLAALYTAVHTPVAVLINVFGCLKRHIAAQRAFPHFLQCGCTVEFVDHVSEFFRYFPRRLAIADVDVTVPKAALVSSLLAS